MITKYALRKDDEYIEFNTEREACRFLGVPKCSVSSAYIRGHKCRGYIIEKLETRTTRKDKVQVKEDITGWKMWEHGVSDSKLTVVEQVEDYIDTNGRHRDQWLCQCSCGSHPFISRGDGIKDGNVKSCGCMVKESAQVYRKSNIYDLTGEYGVGWTTNTNEEFYFDIDDYDLIKDYAWHVSVSQSGYKMLRTYDADIGKDITMAHILGGKHYDHKNRNPLDNRRCNLRPATVSENAANCSVSKRNTTGVVGVMWGEHKQRWFAFLTKDGKRVLYRSYRNFEDAVKARLNAEIKYFGEFAPQQHLYEEYGIKDCPKEVD